MQFSKRTAWDAAEDPWTAARQGGTGNLIDLTLSNPAACGLGPDANAVMPVLADPAAMLYRPDPLGTLTAREAVVGYYRDHGGQLRPDRLCLTTSTSEAYSFLFRLLCDPSDEVLIARPSYPLFDLLADLENVVLRSYPLLYDPGALAGAGGGWSLDLHALTEGITPRTRAVVVVHPNNPTGNYATEEERVALRKLCAERDLALLVDEVFLDFPVPSSISPGSSSQVTLRRSFAAEESECLGFVMSGLSKVCALPQMKLSWIAALGPQSLVAPAMNRLEIIADTFLSLNAPVQHALPHWLGAREAIQEQIRQRIADNLFTLDSLVAKSDANRLGIEGGWTAVLRVPATVGGEAFALAALRNGVLVQPGDLYGLPSARCVLSLLTPPEPWAAGLRRLPIW